MKTIKTYSTRVEADMARGEASFVFWNAVNPSMEAPGETPVSHGPENKWNASLVGRMTMFDTHHCVMIGEQKRGPRSNRGERLFSVAGAASIVVGVGAGMEGGTGGVQLLVEEDRVEQALKVLGDD